MAGLDSNEKINYYPLFLSLKGRKVTVIGGGTVAQRKIEALLSTGAHIEIISPDVTKTIQEYSKGNKVSIKKRKYQKGDLRDSWLVIAATDDPEVQQEVFLEAEGEKIFCNVVDKPELCSFIMPSVVSRGQLNIAISTGGQSPALAKHLRKRLEREFGPEWECFVELIGILRKQIISAFSGTERINRLNLLVDERCLGWIKESRWDQIKDWARDILQPETKALEDIVESWRHSCFK